MFESPTKRRKIKGHFEMANLLPAAGNEKQQPQATLTASSKETQAIPWPANLLPVEIFVLVISYLPRSNIQKMRLVNKEFEEKVSEYLFRVVVVPFKPEIYGIAPEPGLGLPILTVTRGGSAIMLQDKGMRVFQGFGRRIRKFAMSFEFEEDKLANPPLKNDQEAITSFWGIYRWPYQKYNRYQQLAGLEQTADETRTMAKALRFIECAKELGLSIDGGLGWLNGPDLNNRVVSRGLKVPVFGESRFVPEPTADPTQIQNTEQGRSCPPILSNREDAYTIYERMLQEAGYAGAELDSSVQMLLQTENRELDSQRTHLLSQLASELTNASVNAGNHPEMFASPTRNATTNVSFNQAADLIAAQQALLAEGDDSEDNEDAQAGAVAVSGLKIAAKGDTYSLKPNDLTNAQREMLLEVEWAQRAFMQSYAIAIIDNPATFQHIEALTIARLPNRHLPILRREDFWESLPQLKTLSLSIIPCWREVAKLPTSWVQDIRITPSESVSGVFQILNDQIGRRESITSIHFEWLCGGEEAPGLFSRNQHILAAPLVSNAKEMVNRLETPDILSLPYVRHLSLKNCWASPHILTRFGVSCRKTALQKLTLHSVSLSASLLSGAHPNPITIGANAGIAAAHHANAQHQILMVNLGLPGLPPPPPLPAGLQLAVPQAPAAPLAATTPTNDWLQPPRVGSWAGIIDILTPSYTLAHQRYLKDLGPKPPRHNPGRLTKMEFNSCGYVRLPLDFDQTALDPQDLPGALPTSVTKRIDNIESIMLKANDPMLGVIVNHIDPNEARTLENAFLLTTEWDKTDPDRIELGLDCVTDGVKRAGTGRFEGIIGRVIHQSETSMRRRRRICRVQARRPTILLKAI